MPNMSVSKALYQIHYHLDMVKQVSGNDSKAKSAPWCVDPQKMHIDCNMPLEMGEELRKLSIEWAYMRDYVNKIATEMPDFAFEPDFHKDLLDVMSIDDQAQTAIAKLVARMDVYIPIWCLLGEIEDIRNEYMREIKDLEAKIDDIRSDHKWDIRGRDEEIAKLEAETEKLEKEVEKLEKEVASQEETIYKLECEL